MDGFMLLAYLILLIVAIREGGMRMADRVPSGARRLAEAAAAAVDVALLVTAMTRKGDPVCAGAPGPLRLRLARLRLGGNVCEGGMLFADRSRRARALPRRLLLLLQLLLL